MALTLMPKCPCSCGAEDEKIVLKGKNFRGRLLFRVKCEKCGRESNKFGNPDEAIRDWNRINQREG